MSIEIAVPVEQIPEGMSVMPCRDEDPELFFPVPETIKKSVLPTPAAQMAIAVCNTCVVRTECLNYALAWGETNGIWGGTTGPERQKILHRSGRVALRGEIA